MNIQKSQIQKINTPTPSSRRRTPHHFDQSRRVTKIRGRTTLQLIPELRIVGYTYTVSKSIQNIMISIRSFLQKRSQYYSSLYQKFVIVQHVDKL